MTSATTWPQQHGRARVRQADFWDEQTYARLKECVFKDEATGLYNQRFFSNRLAREISRHQRFKHPVSVVLLHLDGLGCISDEFGHAAGDKAARAVADVLLKHTGDINVLSRYDSELFAVLMVETPLKGARLYIDRIRYVLSRSTFKHSDRVTAHFGRAGLPDCKAAVGEELVRQAEESLRATRGEPEPKRAKPTGLDDRQLNLVRMVTRCKAIAAERGSRPWAENRAGAGAR